MRTVATASSVRRLRAVLFAAAAAALPFATATPAPLRPGEDGIIGYSGQGGSHCTDCRSGGVEPTVALAGPRYVLLGSKRTFEFRVSNGQKKGAGLNVAVDSGTLVATDAETYLDTGELTHTTPRAVDGNGEAAWSFDWTAPTTTGPTTIWAAGNSVNLNSTRTGDKSATTTHVVEVVDGLVRFTEFGTGLAGKGGFVPHLAGVDGPSVGPWSVEISDALGGAFSLLHASTETSTTQFFGGNRYVDFTPGFFVIPLTLDGSAGFAGDGSLTLDGDDFSDLAPLTLYAQLAVADKAAPKKVSLSNALQVDIE